MAGSRGGKGGARGGKGGAHSGNGGARSGNGEAGNGGARNVNGGAGSGNGDVGSGGTGNVNSDAGNVNGGACNVNGGTRGRTPSQGCRPPNRKGHDSSRGVADDGSGTGFGRSVIIRGEFNDNGGAGTRKGIRTRGKGSGKGVRTRGNTRYITTCGRYRIERGGHSGSTSRGGAADPMADMCGVLRAQSLNTIPDLESDYHSEDDDYEDVDHEEADPKDTDPKDTENPSSQHDSHVGTSLDASRGRLIRRAGDGFLVEHGDVHKSIVRILSEHHDGAWLTFRQIPREVLTRMFDCFRTRWNWDLANEQAIREGFINVLKNRYRDIMRQMRVKSTRRAVKVHVDMDPKNYRQFDIICDFPPDYMPHNVWRELCARWNTSDWLKKSESGSKNRCSADINGTSSRHTGGSMGYAERRARMKRKMNGEPNFKQIFLETHLTKECKKKVWNEEIDIYNLEELTFCTERAKIAYGDYLSAMHDVYGDDFKEYPDDPEVWARVHAEGRTRRVYGVGSSDLQFLMTGTSSSSVGSAPSHAEYQRSQEEAQGMRTQLVDLEARLEEERKAREELQQQFQDFMKNWRAPDN